MNRVAIAAVSWAAVVCLPAVGFAQEKFDLGKREYESNCAVCHGVKGKGDGPLAGLIETRVPDLTVLSKNNGGVFPLNRVYNVVEGQEDVKAHGPREMPVWGREYQLKAAEYYRDVPYDDSYVHARILALAEYIHRLQQK